MSFQPKSVKSENNNPWFKPWFNILLHTQSIVCATVDSQCLEYLGYITLVLVCLPNCLNKVSYKSTLVSAELQLDCEITLEHVQNVCKMWNTSQKLYLSHSYLSTFPNS